MYYQFLGSQDFSFPHLADATIQIKNLSMGIMLHSEFLQGWCWTKKKSNFLIMDSTCKKLATD
jgi:hypothetical protein